MQPLHVKILDWPITILRIVFLSLIHPSGLVFSEILKSKPLSLPIFAIVLTPLILFYLIIQAFPVLVFVLRGEIQQVVADSSGLKLKAFRKSRHIAWTQIATFEKVQVASGKSLQNVLTLRDNAGSTLVQFKRNLQEGTKLKEKFDQLEGMIAQHVGTRGLISNAPLENTLTQTSFTLTTQLKILGLGSLLIWLPFAYLSWNARTGEPWIGTIFLGFAALGIVLALLDKRHEVDERGIRIFGVFKNEELDWKEIRSIGLGTGSTIFLIVSDQSVLSLPGSANWREGSALLQFLQSQIQRYDIEWHPNLPHNWRKKLLPQRKRRQFLKRPD